VVVDVFVLQPRIANGQHIPFRELSFRHQHLTFVPEYRLR
jgi:hypothetical protein